MPARRLTIDAIRAELAWDAAALRLLVNQRIRDTASKYALTRRQWKEVICQHSFSMPLGTQGGLSIRDV